MRGIKDGVYPLPPMAHILRMRVVEAEPGHLVFVSSPDESLMNPIGTIHGGYAMALLDSCMGCAVHTTCAAGEALYDSRGKEQYRAADNPANGRDPGRWRGLASRAEPGHCRG